MSLRSPTVTLAIALLAACHDRPAGEDGACRCTPGNQSRTRLADGTILDGAALVGKLRRHLMPHHMGRGKSVKQQQRRPLAADAGKDAAG